MAESIYALYRFLEHRHYTVLRVTIKFVPLHILCHFFHSHLHTTVPTGIHLYPRVIEYAIIKKHRLGYSTYEEIAVKIHL